MGGGNGVWDVSTERGRNLISLGQGNRYDDDREWDFMAGPPHFLLPQFAKNCRLFGEL